MAKKRVSDASLSKPYQVFVSHATADKWIATTICEKIEQCGASTFRDDRDIDGGDSIPDKIRTAIQQSRELVVILTPASVTRPWVHMEVGAAWCWRKTLRITPILCHVEVDTIPGILQAKKAIHLNNCEDFFAELTTRVRKYHGDK